MLRHNEQQPFNDNRMFILYPSHSFDSLSMMVFQPKNATVFQKKCANFLSNSATNEQFVRRPKIVKLYDCFTHFVNWPIKSKRNGHTKRDNEINRENLKQICSFKLFNGNKTITTKNILCMGQHFQLCDIFRWTVFKQQILSFSVPM